MFCQGTQHPSSNRHLMRTLCVPGVLLLALAIACGGGGGGSTSEPTITVTTNPTTLTAGAFYTEGTFETWANVTPTPPPAVISGSLNPVPQGGGLSRNHNRQTWF